MKIVAAVGARPNFMKVAPLLWEIHRRENIQVLLVHTGQHYDERMSKLFFEELHIPRPDFDLGVGSASHAVQTAEVMKRFEPVILEQRPDAVLVVGDVNSTLACALTAVKLEIPVAHVEAGLRSFDRSMPEEINRLLTDQISQWLFVSEPSGVDNLRKEGIPDKRVHLVGNVMIDTLLACQARAEESPILDQLQLRDRAYGVLTLHRPANVDEPGMLGGIMTAITGLQKELPIVFPVHPRTHKALNGQINGSLANLKLMEPLGYLDFMKLLGHARLVLTDSGGIQEETTVLGVPCLTLRDNTERPITVKEGTNQLVGRDPERILQAGLQVLGRTVPPVQKGSADGPEAGPTGRSRVGRIPQLWDGGAAGRIVDILSG